ncbi:class F sortase [Cryobacterium psychrophilum]|uniref:Class F sortase n=1 Tax=Cryobacterium psychrophilum TaxID=41988 RepID=A0A4Y8KLE8_9MICO|nr:class F sortase [Cryobacterium psychrophilum]TDW30616.1 LPXTG-site transpeptidase (sortase) family protein [Cryobacterium psychrophilum]TFD77037.1 class F sortase [Cryobacterium psychrophilum]
MRATAGTIAALAVALALLVGCTPTPTGASLAPVPSAAPSAVPTPRPTAEVDVPRVQSALDLNQVPLSVTPQRIRVDTLGIDMSIDAVGLAEDGSMALPSNPAVAAWYSFGPSPTSPSGATVVAAHVDSLVYNIGPFARLAQAPAGTEIIVATDDGQERRYAVESIQTVNKTDVPWDQVFDRTGPSRLTLVTCGGEFDYEARRYLSNVIVSATPIL